MGQDRLESGYMPTLDGWRAVAVVAVMVSHARSAPTAFGWGDNRTLLVASYGRVGVDLFFAISGFLICSRLLDEYARDGGISLGGFYVRRAFRILPLYFAYLGMLWFLAVFAGVPASGAEILSSLAFVRNYATPPQGMYTDHFWSLAVEEHFYLCWPLLLIALTPRSALWATPCFGILVHVWRSADARWHLFPTSLSAAGLLHRTDTRIDAILWGCFAALICAKFPRLRLPGWSAWATLGVLLTATVRSVPALPLLFAMLFPLLVVSTVRGPRGGLGGILELPLLRWVGRLSYSLYVWQTLFLQSSAGPDPEWLLRLKAWPLNLVMIGLCSVLTHYLVERPFVRLGKRLARRSELREPAGPAHERARPATAAFGT